MHQLPYILRSIDTVYLYPESHPIQMLIRHCWSVALGFGSLVLFNACRDLPEYSVEPQISFNNYRVEQESGANQVDNVFLTINYQDGDADLGLGPKADQPADTYPQDNQAPFDSRIIRTDTTPDGYYIEVPNPDYFNFYTTLLIKQPNGSFLPYEFPIVGPKPGPYQLVTFDGRFPRLSPTDEPQPIDGTVTYKVQLFKAGFQQNTVVKFQIQIQDRKRHKSNTVFSPEITINQ